MAWDGSGTFTRTNGTNTGSALWGADRDAGDNILASRHDTHDQDLADGIAACLTKNNESKPTVSFKPNADNTLDLGSSALRWRRAFIAEVRDANANEVLIFSATASAINEITITNAAVGTGPTISATGGDTSIDINLVPKANGAVKATVSSTSTSGGAVVASISAQTTSAHASGAGTTVVAGVVAAATHAANFDLSAARAVSATATNNTSGGNLTELTALRGICQNTAGAVVSMYGVYASVSDSASATDAFGVYIAAVSGATNNWAFYSSASTAPSAFGGSLYIGDTSNANVTLGLTLNQGAADDQILALKSSDVTHGVTTVAETDTYGAFSKVSATNGGLQIDALSEATNALTLRGIGTTASTTKSTVAQGAINLVAALVSGTGVASLGANTNLLSVQDNGTARFFLDADGDSHQDVGTAWTNFDDRDDVAALDALSYLVARDDDPIKRKFGEWMVERRPALEAAKLVTFNDDGHHFVNMSKLAMLNTGAIRQLGEKFVAMASRLEKVERAALPG